MEKMLTVVMSEDEELRGDIVAALEGSDLLELCEVHASPSELEHSIWRVGAELVVAPLGNQADATLACLAALGERSPSVVLCGPGESSQLLLRAMRIGVRDYIPLPLEAADLRHVVKRLSAEREVRETPRRGFVVGVMGAKGGVGATVVACQLAASLQGRGSQTVIVDLNLHDGDVALYNDVSPAHGMADLDREGGDVDRTFLKSLIKYHASGVGIMAAPMQPFSLARLGPSKLQHALSLLREFNHFVVIDLSRDWGDACLAALEAADQVMLITSLDVPSLAHSKLQLRQIERAGVARSDVQIVANDRAPSGNLSKRDIREFLGRPLDHRIPNDGGSVMEAINTGRTLREIASGSSIQRSFDELARDMRVRCGIEKESSREQRRGIARVRHLMSRGRYGTA